MKLETQLSQGMGKFKIYVNAQATVEYGGSSTGQQTGITVIKLGDT